MLVIVYDEHGGFYDHVAPPEVNDRSGYKTLGVRVPALVVGPRVRKFVCHETFEHTSLIATILRRFASNPEHAIRAIQVDQEVERQLAAGDGPGDEPPPAAA